MDATVVLPVIAPVVLPGMLGPVMSMPGHSAAVLAQVTVVLPLEVAAPVMVIGTVWLEVLTDCRIAPAPAVVQPLIAPVPFQLLLLVLANTSRQTVVLMGTPKLYVSRTCEIGAAPGCTCASTVTGSR